MQYDAKKMDIVNCEIAKICDSIWNELYPDDDCDFCATPVDDRALMFLITDLKTIATYRGMSVVNEMFKRHIKPSPEGMYISEHINWTTIKVQAAVRNNWKKAFEFSKSLSSVISYAFSAKDVARLAKLHMEDPEYRKRIEELLTDCNFHEECASFIRGEYSRFLAAYYEEPTESILEESKEGLRILKIANELNISFDDAAILTENAVPGDDFCVLYDSIEDFGKAEAESIGLESWMLPYFDFKKYGEDVLNEDARAILLPNGKVAAR